MFKMIILLVPIFCLGIVVQSSVVQASPISLQTAQKSKGETGAAIELTQSTASHFAALAMKCIHREYPNKLSHVMNTENEVQNPQALHPAFYGCYDWHSSVHGHWMLVRLLRLFPDLPESVAVSYTHLTLPTKRIV